MKERMVPVQQLSDAGDDLVRLAAAKDAEIAALTIRYDTAVKAYQNVVRFLDLAEAKIAALTEQRDRAMAVVAAARKVIPLYKGCRIHEYETELWRAVEDAAALDTPSSPSLPESPEA